MKRKLPLILLCLVFLGMAGYFGARLYLEWSEYRAGELAYEALTQYVHLETSPPAEETPAEVPEEQPTEPVTVPSTAPEVPPEETASPTEPDDTNWPLVDFESLLAINPDVVAWIFIEGTNINYPVVQGGDNSYYLNRLVDGSTNRAGSIFMDYRNESNLSDRNTVFYGHHMGNGTMFNQLTDYKDQAFYEAHPVCLVMTPHGNYKLEFFAGFVTNMNSQAWKLEFESDEEFALWLEEAISQSTFTTAIKPTPQDKVVTFSTCTYEYNDARFVLVGILKQITTAPQ